MECRPKGKFPSKDDVNQNTCYGYGLLGYNIKDYSNIKNKNERTRFKSKRVDRTTMVGWLQHRVIVIVLELKVKRKSCQPLSYV